MRIKSPVGEFPMTVERLAVEERRLVMRGAMGAWPAEVRLEAADIADVVRAVPRRALLGAGAAVAAAVLLARR
jgi:hypothetical protein